MFSVEKERGVDALDGLSETWLIDDDDARGSRHGFGRVLDGDAAGIDDDFKILIDRFLESIVEILAGLCRSQKGDCGGGLMLCNFRGRDDAHRLIGRRGGGHDWMRF